MYKTPKVTMAQSELWSIQKVSVLSWEKFTTSFLKDKLCKFWF